MNTPPTGRGAAAEGPGRAGTARTPRLLASVPGGHKRPRDTRKQTHSTPREEQIWVRFHGCWVMFAKSLVSLSVVLNKPFLQIRPDAFQYVPGLSFPAGLSQSHRAE